MTWPPSSTSPRPISGSARCASGARSPDAPTLPWAGTTGWIPSSRSRSSRSTTQRPAAGVAECQRVRPQEEHRPDHVPRQRGAHPHGVADEEILLEPPRVGRGDVRRREVAEPGGDPVHDLARGHEPLDDGARLLHPGPGVPVEDGASPTPGHRFDVRDRQVRAGQGDDTVREVGGAGGSISHSAEHSPAGGRPTGRSADRPPAAPRVSSPAMLAFIDEIVIPFLETLYGAVGYLGVMLAMAIESAMIPLPSELILPFAGFLVSDPARSSPSPASPGASGSW